MSIRFDVIPSGPVFNGALRKAVKASVNNAETAVGEAGVNLVQQRLGEVLRNPTGFYESQIQTDRAGPSVLVHDGGVVYGPWLEGVSSRNVSSRFKGYATFRRTKGELQAVAAKISEPVVRARVKIATT